MRLLQELEGEKVKKIRNKMKSQEELNLEEICIKKQIKASKLFEGLSIDSLEKKRDDLIQEYQEKTKGIGHIWNYKGDRKPDSDVAEEIYLATFRLIEMYREQPSYSYESSIYEKCMDLLKNTDYGMPATQRWNWVVQEVMIAQLHKDKAIEIIKDKRSWVPM